MKKLIAVLFAFLAVTFSARTIAAGSGVTGAPSSTKACAAEYTRATPYECIVTLMDTCPACETSTAITTACTAVAIGSAGQYNKPTVAEAAYIKWARLQMTVSVTSDTAAAMSVGTYFYSDSGCTTRLPVLSDQSGPVSSIYGFAALFTTPILATARTDSNRTTVLVKTNGASTIYAKKTQNPASPAGGGSSTVYAHGVLGYTD